MTTAHTPTPWEKCGGATPSYTCIKSGDQYIIFGMADSLVDEEHGNPISAPDMWTQQANAAHIVKCVNMHDELVEALEVASKYKMTHEDDLIVVEALKKAGAL